MRYHEKDLEERDRIPTDDSREEDLGEPTDKWEGSTGNISGEMTEEDTTRDSDIERERGMNRSMEE